MKKLILVLLIVITAGCKNENKAEEQNTQAQTAEVEEPIKELIIEFQFKTNQEDEFKLMLNDIIKDDFQKKNIHILEKVIPTTSAESMTANFGENISNNFQFNLGNKVPKEVEIFSMNVSYGSNSVQITPQNINDYFAVNNKYVQYDTVTNTLKTMKVEGRHFPTILMRSKTLRTLRGE